MRRGFFQAMTHRRPQRFGGNRAKAVERQGQSGIVCHQSGDALVKTLTDRADDQRDGLR